MASLAPSFGRLTLLWRFGARVVLAVFSVRMIKNHFLDRSLILDTLLGEKPFKISFIELDGLGFGFERLGQLVIRKGLFMLAQSVIADTQLNIRDVIIAIL